MTEALDPTILHESGRRQFLRVAGAAALGAVLLGCSDDGEGAATSTTGGPTTVPATTAVDEPLQTTVPIAELTAADFASLGTCRLTPEKTAGPFPLDEQFVRRDIREDQPGHPLRLGLRLLDENCNPVPGAEIEVWHADSTGDYSAFVDNGGGKDDGPGTTFLRGTQLANAEGIVEFLSIYPGWYRGRAVHIHLRVHSGDRVVSTSQLFFDGAYTESVYASAPYSEFGLPDTTNATDSIAGDAEAEGTIASTAAGETNAGTGTLALLNLSLPAASLVSA